MAERVVTIMNRLGLHARAAARFVELASSFRCRLEVLRGADAVDAKSLLGLLSLAAPHGAQLRLVAEGPDADEALAQLAALVAAGFGERD